MDERIVKLSDGLRAVADEDRALSASAAVEQRLLADVRSIARNRRRRVAATALTMAALVAIAAAVPLWKQSRAATSAARAGASAVGDGSTGATVARAEAATPFLPLPYSSVPLSDGHLVRLEVPRAALVSFGLAPIDAGDATGSATVLADVLVGDDGLARAVRFVAP